LVSEVVDHQQMIDNHVEPGGCLHQGRRVVRLRRESCEAANATTLCRVVLNDASLFSNLSDSSAGPHSRGSFVTVTRRSRMLRCRQLFRESHDRILTVSVPSTIPLLALATTRTSTTPGVTLCRLLAARATACRQVSETYGIPSSFRVRPRFGLHAKRLAVGSALSQSLPMNRPIGLACCCPASAKTPPDPLRFQRAWFTRRTVDTSR